MAIKYDDGVDNLENIICYRRLIVSKRFIKNFNTQSLSKNINIKINNITVCVLKSIPVVYSSDVVYMGEDAITVIHSLFNNNSLNCLYQGKCWYDKKMIINVKVYKQELKTLGINNEDCIIDSSAVMALYGLRKANDLDFICTKNDDLVLHLKSTDCHNQYAVYYETNIEGVVYNPSGYFWYDGIKFIMLGVLESYKNNRGEAKDKMDLVMIRYKLSPNCNLLDRVNYVWAKILISLIRFMKCKGRIFYGK